MPENSTIDPSDFKSRKDNLVVVLIDGKRYYGELPKGLMCPNTDQYVAFERIYDDEEGKFEIAGYTVAKPLIEESTDTSDYGVIGPESVPS